MRVQLLVNPVAGKGKAKKALARLLTVLDQKRSITQLSIRSIQAK